MRAWPKYDLPYHLLVLLLLLLVSLLLVDIIQAAMRKPGEAIAIAGRRQKYDGEKIEAFTRERLCAEDGSYCFGRFRSPSAIRSALERCRGGRDKFRFHEGKDGRRGWVSTTRLGGDWVLAESEQTAVACTAEEVLTTYLSGELQKRWNADKLIDCEFTLKTSFNEPPYYRQDLFLKSQRVVSGHTGVMKYSQRITVDRVGRDKYCVAVQIDPRRSATARKPFEKLSVYVGVEQQGADVRVYAAGVMKVNRRVVPNLIVFDASGIAGSMAGRGTLWLAGHFAQRKRSTRAEEARSAVRKGRQLKSHIPASILPTPPAMHAMKTIHDQIGTTIASRTPGVWESTKRSRSFGQT